MFMKFLFRSNRTQNTTEFRPFCVQYKLIFMSEIIKMNILLKTRNRKGIISFHKSYQHDICTARVCMRSTYTQAANANKMVSAVCIRKLRIKKEICVRCVYFFGFIFNFRNEILIEAHGLRRESNFSSANNDCFIPKILSRK